MFRIFVSLSLFLFLSLPLVHTFHQTHHAVMFPALLLFPRVSLPLLASPGVRREYVDHVCCAELLVRKHIVSQFWINANSFGMTLN